MVAESIAARGRRRLARAAGLGVATGLTDKFSWKGVAMAGISAGLTEGFTQAAGSIASAARAAAAANSATTISSAGRVASYLAGGSIGAQVVRSVVTDVASQGIAVATGLQKKFDWAGVAAGAAGAGIGALAGQRLEGLGVNGLQSRILSGVAGGIASAGTRSVLTGTSFGDNIAAVLPGVIANTIGNLIGDALTGSMGQDRGAAATLHEHAHAAGQSDMGTVGEAPLAWLNPLVEDLYNQEVARAQNSSSGLDEASLAWLNPIVDELYDEERARAQDALWAPVLAREDADIAAQAAGRLRTGSAIPAPSGDGVQQQFGAIAGVTSPDANWRTFLEGIRADPAQRTSLPGFMVKYHLTSDATITTTGADIITDYDGDHAALRILATDVVTLSAGGEYAPQNTALARELVVAADALAAAEAARQAEWAQYSFYPSASQVSEYSFLNPPDYQFSSVNLDMTQYSYQGRNYSRATYPGPIIRAYRPHPPGYMSPPQLREHLNRLSGGGTFESIAYGIAHANNAEPATLDLVSGLGRSADGLVVGRYMGPRTGRPVTPYPRGSAPTTYAVQPGGGTAPSSATIPTIGGRIPINSRYAGGTHPSGVTFTPQGFPDFGPHVQIQVRIQNLTGNTTADAALANKALGYPSTPRGSVWHHVEDGVTMQLIPRSIHDATRHTGGAAVIRNRGFDR